MMTENQDTMHLLDHWRIIRSRKEIVITFFLLVVATGIFLTYRMPKVYMASTLIQVKQESPDVDVWEQRLARFDPLFLRTQFEIIQSRPVIEEVVRRLDLDEKLGNAYGYRATLGEKSFEHTIKRLSKKIKVQQYRDTNLIEIQIYLDEPMETVLRDVADTANMMAEVYRGLNMKRSRDATERALDALHEQLENEQKKVGEAESKLEDIRQKYQIDIVSSAAGTDSALSKISMERLDAQRIETRMELADKESRFKKIESLSPDKLMDAAAYIVNDSALAALVAEKRQTEVELSRLQEAYGPKHPEVVRVAAMIKELTAKTEEALTGLETGVRADYEATKAKLEILDGELEAVKTKERSAEAGGYREFKSATAEVERARRIRDALETRYVEEQIEMRIPRTTVEMIEPAKPPDEKDYVSPNLLLNLILSIAIGLGAGIGIAYFSEYLDTSIKTIEDIERHMGVSVLGVIPQKVKALSETGADAAQAEAYRVLRTNVRFSNKMNDGGKICVTSGSVGEGKSLTLFNLAYVCAQLGDRTLVVDSDLHRPRQHKLFGLSNAVGLANVLVGDVRMEDAILATNISNMDFLPSGRMSSPVHGLLDTRRMGELVKDLKKDYDFVFFDAPPMIGVSDASLLVREVDGVLLVIQHRKYPRTVASRARDMIQNVGGNLLGVVLNNINISRDYSYYYYHQQYYTSEKKSSAERKS